MTTASVDLTSDARGVPLVVDLDGTLIRSDLLAESAFKLVCTRPWALGQIPVWLMQGKAALKQRIANDVTLDVKTLPYDQRVVDWVRAQRAAGRRTVLCTASDQAYARAVAEHLGVFDDVLASDGQTNLSAERKAARLVERFGARQFDYAGNSSDDLPVWKQAREAIVVNAKASVQAQAAASDQIRVTQSLPRTPTQPLVWIRGMRLHQWLKNVLVLLPLAGAYMLDDMQRLQQALLAFLAFGLCASAVYVLNDLIDLENDRAHPRKRLRPFAAGQLSIGQGLLFALGLFASAWLIARMTTPQFLAWLGIYFFLTFSYSTWLKRRVIIDCLMLGGLYTVRIVAGCAAVQLPVSFWLLAFSMFLFLSLAFVKRYAELVLLAGQGRGDVRGRGYLIADTPLVQAMGVASGFSAVLVLALYINGDVANRSYSHPQLLWLTVPVLLYWVCRMWMQAQRGNMHEDPVVFALRDPYSLACAGLFAAALAVSR